MRPGSLRTLALLFLSIFLAAIILTAATTFMATHATIAALVDDRLVLVSRSIVGQGSQDLADIRERAQAVTDRRDTADLGIVLRGTNGRLLLSNVAVARQLPRGFSDLDTRAEIKGLSFGRAFVLDLGRGASLAVIGETEPIDNFNAARARIYLVGFGTIVLIVLGGMLLFGTIIGRRISALNRTADAIIDGDLSQRVPDSRSRGEFDEQARTFNRMLDRINELVAEISAVTSDVAHDLRTPLSRLRGQLGALVRESSDERTRQGLFAALAQCDELLDMFTSMLRIAEIEGEQRRAGFVRVDVRSIIGDIAMIMEPVAVEGGHELIEGTVVPSYIDGDRRLLTQALINLVENAIRYTPAGSRIVPEALDSNGRLIITVTDNGPGIASDKHKLALRHFGRLERARDGEGHGLGLPMVQAIARLHRGTLTLNDACPGLSAAIDLPLDGT